MKTRSLIIVGSLAVVSGVAMGWGLCVRDQLCIQVKGTLMYANRKINAVNKSHRNVAETPTPRRNLRVKGL